jgi:hypothetical protein
MQSFVNQMLTLELILKYMSKTAFLKNAQDQYLMNDDAGFSFYGISQGVSCICFSICRQKQSRLCFPKTFLQAVVGGGYFSYSLAHTKGLFSVPGTPFALLLSRSRVRIVKISST